MAGISKKQKVLIITTHPVQYQVPWFRHLHTHVNDYEFEVLYLTIPDADKQGVGFGESFAWDIPLFDGYSWTQVKSEFISEDSGLENFFSIRLKNTTRLIRSLNPDAVLLTGWQCMGLVQALWSCRRLNIPCLIRAESNNLKPRAKYKSVVHSLLLKQYDKYLAIGKANRNFYLLNKVQENDIFHCPYFVDNDFFKNEAQSNKTLINEIRNKWGIEEKALCFCYVGKLNTKKRIIDVLEAFKKLADQHVHLLVVGNGKLMPDALAYVQTHQLNVSFTGFLNQSEISTAYSVSHCLILASDFDETWGLVVNEAMACGLPAIVSRRSGCHLDLIEDNATGFTFEFGNTDDLALKMRSMTTLKKREYEKMSQQAKLNILDNYSISVASKGLQDALNALI